MFSWKLLLAWARSGCHLSPQELAMKHTPNRHFRLYVSRCTTLQRKIRSMIQGCKGRDVPLVCVLPYQSSSMTAVLLRQRKVLCSRSRSTPPAAAPAELGSVTRRVRRVRVRRMVGGRTAVADRLVAAGGRRARKSLLSSSVKTTHKA